MKATKWLENRPKPVLTSLQRVGMRNQSSSADSRPQGLSICMALSGVRAVGWGGSLCRCPTVGTGLRDFAFLSPTASSMRRDADPGLRRVAKRCPGQGGASS